jgi:hypothetical protein
MKAVITENEWESYNIEVTPPDGMIEDYGIEIPDSLVDEYRRLIDQWWDHQSRLRAYIESIEPDGEEAGEDWRDVAIYQNCTWAQLAARATCAHDQALQWLADNPPVLLSRGFPRGKTCVTCGTYVLRPEPDDV